MIGERKVIGVCLSKIEDDFRNTYLAKLHMNAIENDYKLIVFNSQRDLYYGDEYDTGSGSIFGAINYDTIDALIILYEAIYNHNVTDRIISKAKEHNVPVVIVHGEIDGCYNILSDYTEAYREVVRHVLGYHHAKKVCFIGGRKDPLIDPSTVKRLNIFKEVLAEYNIPFTDDMLLYGDYWDAPTVQAVREIISRPGGIPDAVICANDTMAMTACEEFEANGYKVPDDVIVTGFDGLVSAEYFMPRLTTCKEDIADLAEMTIGIVDGALSDELDTGVFYENYVPDISESCGCGHATDINYRERARYMYKLTQDMQRHEGHIYTWVDSVLDSDNLNTLSVALHDYILPNSSVCLEESFIMTAMGHDGMKVREQGSSELIVITSMSVDYTSGRQGRFLVSDMVPDVNSWLKNETMCILTPIFVGSEVCGYYALNTDDITSTAHKLFRVAKTMNIAFSSLLNRLLKKDMQSSIQNVKFIDILTGLPNLKGLSKWFDEFSAIPENHNKHIMVSVYAIPQYKFIYENYGMDDVEDMVRFTADALRLANKDNGYIARTGDDEFIIVNYVDTEEQVAMTINNATSVFFGVIEGYNTSSDKDYFLEVNCGCTVGDPGWNGTLRSLIKLANAEMYMNRLKAGFTPVMKDEKASAAADTDKEKEPKDLYSEFSILIEKNLFTYFFQPIIDAKTGEIYAYEALMRTKGGIKMSPLEILDIAKEYNRLYEIEKATMFNVMECYVNNMPKFAKAKVFINTIPGNFLKQDDLAQLKEKYGKYISNFVIEITEQDTVSDEELDAIRHLGIIGNTEEYADREGGQIAVDDYGTGHSNIVNLLRYAPHIIKIDRFLISNIQNDPNKQMFVKSTIEFAKMNNIKVLAEGVETFEEMRTVIEYGVDLIQGYYTARPAEEPITSIPESIRREVIDENILLSRYDSDLLTYRAQKNETIDLYELALKKFGCVQIPGGNVTLVGSGGGDVPVQMDIRTDEGSVSEITFEDISLKASDGPVIQLGGGSITVITLKGKNFIHKNGISVPDDASLRITGDGDLTVTVKRNGGVGIGGGYESAFGDLSFEQSGTVQVDVSIDRGVGIGGGIASKGSSISFSDGKAAVNCQCLDSLGVGCVNGKADITISEGAKVVSKCGGKRSVALGSYDGEAEIYSSGKLILLSDGELTAACGTLGIGTSYIRVDGGEISAVVHGDDAVCLGSIRGRTDIECSKGRVTAYGEGDSVCGVGSAHGAGLTHIGGGTVYVKILSGNIMQFGNGNNITIITGGNILADKPGDVHAVNDFGEPLHCYYVREKTEYTETISSHIGGDYIYHAELDQPDDELCVYIP